jgi:hypothetical protein
MFQMGKADILQDGAEIEIMKEDSQARALKFIMAQVKLTSIRMPVITNLTTSIRLMKDFRPTNESHRHKGSYPSLRCSKI